MPDDSDDQQNDDKGTGATPTPSVTELQQQVEHWREQARKQEKRAKDNAAAATELQRLKDADKSEGERASEAAKAAEERAAKAERELMRLTVAAEKGLTPSQARRLQGDSEDDLRADADALLQDFPSKPAATATSRRPTEALGAGAGGGDPTDQPEELDPDKLAAAVTAAQ